MPFDELLQRITIDPDIRHGKPCIRGMRYPVQYMMEYLAGGDTLDVLIAHFPDLCAQDFFACDEYSRRSGITKTELARRMHLSTQYPDEIIVGAKAIGKEFAQHLQNILNAPAHIGLGLESKYRIVLARAQSRRAR